VSARHHDSVSPLKVPKKLAQTMKKKKGSVRPLSSPIQTSGLSRFIEPILVDTVTDISLACWIVSLDDANAFPVDILHSQTVGHLKDAIKKKKENALNHIDVDQLKIWKVGDPARSIPGTTDV
jgi:hypothetical protein